MESEQKEITLNLVISLIFFAFKTFQMEGKYSKINLSIKNNIDRKDI